MIGRQVRNQPGVVRNEFGKMRGLRAGLVAGIMVAAVAGVSVLSAVVGPGFSPTSPEAWNLLLAGLSLAVPLLSPLLLAVLASRQVDIEHQGQGWLSAATSGVGRGTLCRAKVAALALVVVAATAGQVGLVALAGGLLGVREPFPAAHWAGFAVCVAVVNVVVLTVHVLLAAAVDNQLVGLGVGVLGTLFAVFAQGLPAWAAGLTPWGHYALVRGADFVGESVVALPLPIPAVGALLGVTAVVFTLITIRHDAQEA